MATTTLIPLHAGKGGTVAAALGRTVDYIRNPDKTDGGEWVSAYECDPLTADAEFLFSKNQYAAITGRDHGARDVIGYHLRQSFKPGETDAATANRIGYELALKLTKGEYAFVCCTHTDKKHIHSHIVINSVSLDCTRKFRNFKGSSFAVRKISDTLCLENGLSIIAEPKKSKGKTYGQWLGEKPKTERDKLRGLIDEKLIVGGSYPDLLVSLKRAGCEVKIGKHDAVKIPGGKKFLRFDSLGEDYMQAALKERLMGTRTVEQRAADTDAERKTAEYAESLNKSKAPSLLIDIQAKIREGAGAGYVQWMRILNLKTAARTLIFLQEHGIDSYDELSEKADAASHEFHTLKKRLKAIETRQKEITELQKQIGTYGKTRAVYAAYKKRGWSRDYYDVNTADIVLHRAAKKYFNEQNFTGKLPSINTLKQEWATLETERRKLYSGYKTVKENMLSICTARANADVMLFGSRQTQRTRERGAR
jgi:hypothetical protein